jgi:hypothetical protein
MENQTIGFRFLLLGFSDDRCDILLLDFMEEFNFIMDVFWCVCNDRRWIYFGECNEIMIK